MLRLKNRLERWEGRLLETAAAGFGTPEGRRSAAVHFNVFDHAFLRTFWKNEAEIAPGIWRANQPGPRRIARYARHGFRTVLSLRGQADVSYNLFEREACEQSGLIFRHLNLRSTVLPPGETLLALLDLVARAEKPMLFHCKSGADRTGLAAALILIDQTGASIDEALKQLHWRHLHFRKGKAGILGQLVESYGKARQQSGITLRDWLVDGYEPERITASWRTGRPAR